MSRLDLNGVAVCFAMHKELDQAGINAGDRHLLDDFGVVPLLPLQRRDAPLAVGFDLCPADFALLQGQVDENCRGRGRFRPEDWLWNCSGPSGFG